MALTGKIRVKNVRAADPQLTFTLEVDDSGTFPAEVKVVANLTGVSSYVGQGVESGGSASPINYDITFTDPNYSIETTLTYALTIYFPTTNPAAPWTPFTGTVIDGTGTVVCSH